MAFAPPSGGAGGGAAGGTILEGETVDGSVIERDAVYFDGVDWKQANVAAAATSVALGLATNVSGGTADIVQGGIVTGFAGLTPGDKMYLSSTTPGGITTPKPVVAGGGFVLVGLVKTATDLFVGIEHRGFLAS